jgi:hypothetical protein
MGPFSQPAALEGLAKAVAGGPGAGSSTSFLRRSRGREREKSAPAFGITRAPALAVDWAA